MECSCVLQVFWGFMKMLLDRWGIWGAYVFFTNTNFRSVIALNL